MTEFQKLAIALRYYLIGTRSYSTLRAWNFAEKLHSGFRKDGVTPEFQHQIEIALFLRTLPVSGHGFCGGIDTLLSVALLHDTSEDKDISVEEITAKFGENVAKHVKTLSKVYRDEKIDTGVYYVNIAKDPLTALVKGADRLHNVSSMVGVFTDEKIKKYVIETYQYVIPMLKEARREFPEYENAFENIKHNLLNQLKLIKLLTKFEYEPAESFYDSDA